jgi:hypothetical protein
MTFRHFASIVVCVLTFACTPPESNQSATNAENQAGGQTDVGHVASKEVQVETTYNFKGTDAAELTAELLEISSMDGSLISSEIITHDVLDVSAPGGERELIAIWIQTGAGEYQGTREREYQTVYSRLAVFERADTVTALLNLKDFESVSQGLYLYEQTVETFDLTATHQAIVIHHLSSEEGAGDSGFSKDEIEVYAIKENELYTIFSTPLNESSFSSDEMGSYSESNTTRELKILEESSNGLFDISIYAVTSETSFEEPEETEELDSESQPDSEESSEEETELTADQSDASESPDNDDASKEEYEPPTIIYRWNGTQYLADGEM